MKPIKKIALLHDMCGVGKAALTNMLPILSVMGMEVCPIPTVLLSTHTGGYGLPAMHKVDPDYITQCANHYVANGVTFDVIFIGYLGNADMIEAVKYFISCFSSARIIMDPIMGDHGKYYSNFNKHYCEALKTLVVYTDILLPNITECCFLADIEYGTPWTPQKLKRLCKNLTCYDVDDIIITSVPVGGTEKGIIMYHEQQIAATMENCQLPSEYHGTGDAFDGVFIGSLLQGRHIRESVTIAHEFVCACIKESDLHNYNKREGLMIEKNLQMLV